MASTKVVLDVGSAFTKAGFADSPTPSYVFPTAVGVPVPLPSKGSAVFFGEAAFPREKVEDMNVSLPVQEGRVTSVEGWEKIVHHSLYSGLCVVPESSQVLLMTRPSTVTDTKGGLESLLSVLFESLCLEGVVVTASAPLVAFGNGCTAGLVVDSGAGTTHVVPVVGGAAVEAASVEFPVGGDALTKYTASLLERQGFHLSTVLAPHRTALQAIKGGSSVSPTPLAEGTTHLATLPSRTFVLPDGRNVTLPASEDAWIPEPLFASSLLGSYLPTRTHGSGGEALVAPPPSSLASALRGCLEALDEGSRLEVCASPVVLTGGNFMFPSLLPRLQSELGGGFPMNLPSAASFGSDPSELLNGGKSFLGASMLAETVLWEQLMLTRADYSEGIRK